MDRFIEFFSSGKNFRLLALKSNMDRFIELSFSVGKIKIKTLKSNMDRFIDSEKYILPDDQTL